jgi:hypothetical protein
MTRLIAALGCVALAACGGGGDDGGKAGDRVACARLQTGPFQTLVPSATPDNPPEVDGALAYRLSGDGFVFYGAQVPGDHGIFLDTAIDVVVTDAAGTVIEPSEVSNGTTECADVERRVVVPMAVGVYDLEVTGIGAEPVTLTVQPVALDTDP